MVRERRRHRQSDCGDAISLRVFDYIAVLAKVRGSSRTLGPADLCSRSLRCAGRSLWWMRTGTVGFPSSDETGALTAGGSGGSSSAMQESMLGAADAASSAPDDVEAGSGSGSSASGGLALSVCWGTVRVRTVRATVSSSSSPWCHRMARRC